MTMEDLGYSAIPDLERVYGAIPIPDPYIATYAMEAIEYPKKSS